MAAPGLPRNPGIDNTAYLFFALAAAFFFWITVRGDLPKWLGLFGLASGSSPTAPAQSAGTVSVAGNLPALPAIGSPVAPTQAAPSTSAFSGVPSLAAIDAEMNALSAS